MCWINHEQNKPTASEWEPPKKTPGEVKGDGVPLWNMPGEVRTHPL